MMKNNFFVNGHIVRIGSERKSDVVNLFRDAEKNKTRDELFRGESTEFFDTVLNENLSFGYVQNNELKAYGLLQLIKEKDKNKFVANIERNHECFFKLCGSVVTPELRGNGIQKGLAVSRLHQFSSDRLYGCFATASPLNMASIKSFLNSGMVITNLTELYDGMTRYVFYWEPEMDVSGDRMSISTNDYDGQKKLFRNDLYCYAIINDQLIFSYITMPKASDYE